MVWTPLDGVGMVEDVDRSPLLGGTDGDRHVELEVRVLGAPCLALEGGEQPFPPGRPGRLLASLLLVRGRALPVERLVDDVWGEDLPVDARAALHTTVARTRRALGALGDRLDRRPAGYRFDLEGAVVDADVMLERLAHARAHPTVEAYDAALSVWRGQPWAPWADDIAQGEALQLQEAHLAAREERAALLVREGRIADAVGELRLLVAGHPLRDRPVALLMESLHRLGAAADALAVFARHREALADELGLDPAPELMDLQRRVLLREQVQPPAAPETDPPAEPLSETGGRRSGGAPPRLTALYGRAAELNDLGRLLRLHRLVTVLGPGGVGKTALVRNVVADAGSVWWVDLAPVSTEAGVRAVTSTALDVEVFPGGTPEAALSRRLATAEGVLVLDNCEHVVGPAADLAAEVLAGGAGLQVLATSRERLGLPEEQAFWLPPLELPRDGAGDPEVASVALFLDRARAASPDLVVDGPTAVAARTLVRALDGLPLAIELAASRVGVVSLATLQRRLDDNVDILRRHHRRGPSRHQTLTATIEWSYDLLDEPEQRAFRWLSLFSGTFTLEDAEALLGRDSVEPVLALVERSLLVRPGSQQEEYGMLTTLRSFARELLGEEERAGAEAAHAAWAVSVAAAARRGLQTGEEAHWDQVVERRLPDLAAAVRRSITSEELSVAVSIVGDLLDWAYWRVRLDVLAWGRELAEHPSGRGETPLVLATAAAHAWVLGEHAAASRFARRGVDVGGGPERSESLPALNAVIDTALALGELESGYEACLRADALARRQHEPTYGLVAASGMVLIRVYQRRPCADELRLLRSARDRVASPTFRAFGLYTEAEAITADDPDRALELLSQARVLAESVHARFAVEVSLAAETALRARVGALDADTVDRIVRALAHWLDSGNDSLFVTALRNVVTLLDRFGAHREAVALVAATAAHTPDRPSYGEEKERLDAALARARAALSLGAFDAAWSEGLASSLEEVARRTVEVLRSLV